MCPHYIYMCRLFFVGIMFYSMVKSSFVTDDQEDYHCPFGKCPKRENVYPDCQVPNGGVPLLGNSKYIFVNQKVRWEEGRNYCKQNGLEYASIKSLNEQDLVEKFIHTYMQKGQYPEQNTSAVYGSFWFGANDYNTEGTFHWINGEEIEFQKFWYHNPNNDRMSTGGKYGEHCVEIMYFPNSTESWWNDQFCGQKKPFFCEFPTNKFKCFSQPSYVEAAKMPELIEIEKTGFYHSGTLQLNWAEAYNFCEDEGLGLVSIHDAEAVKLIENVVKFDTHPFTHYWTSGVFSATCCDKKNDQFETLNWQTLKESGNYKSGSFMKWWKKEPSDEGGIREENCVEFLNTGNGKIEFSAVHCSLPLQFICASKPAWECRCPRFLY